MNELTIRAAFICNARERAGVRGHLTERDIMRSL
jgi:hypothetical protein